MLDDVLMVENYVNSLLKKVIWQVLTF